MTTVGLIGGTGDLGTALAVHLSKKHRVMLGSRTLEKVKSVVNEIVIEKNRDYIRQNLEAAENHTVVKESDFLILTVPHENARGTISSLANDFRGKQILVSAVAAVAKIEDEFVVDLASSREISFAETIKQLVPESVKIAAAFQTIPANVLYKEKEISADVPIAGESREVYDSVASIVSEIQGLRPLYLGSLRQAGEVERLTALLLNIGRKNGLKSPTIKFTSF
jgi:8-hydroxy-5-deazaflavin:NADPH oxidoreductase